RLVRVVGQGAATTPGQRPPDAGDGARLPRRLAAPRAGGGVTRRGGRHACLPAAGAMQSRWRGGCRCWRRVAPAAGGAGAAAGRPASWPALGDVLVALRLADVHHASTDRRLPAWAANSGS